MIFETLAAIADWTDDQSFNFSATTANCKTAIDTKNSAGLLPLANETLTVGSGTANVISQSDGFALFARGILAKTPRTTLESQMATYA